MKLLQYSLIISISFCIILIIKIVDQRLKIKGAGKEILISEVRKKDKGLIEGIAKVCATLALIIIFYLQMPDMKIILIWIACILLAYLLAKTCFRLYVIIFEKMGIYDKGINCQSGFIPITIVENYHCSNARKRDFKIISFKEKKKINGKLNYIILDKDKLMKYKHVLNVVIDEEKK